jgi:hypothetical protein
MFPPPQYTLQPQQFNQQSPDQQQHQQQQQMMLPMPPPQFVQQLSDPPPPPPQQQQQQMYVVQQNQPPMQFLVQPQPQLQMTSLQPQMTSMQPQMQPQQVVVVQQPGQQQPAPRSPQQQQLTQMAPQFAQAMPPPQPHHVMMVPPPQLPMALNSGMMMPGHSNNVNRVAAPGAGGGLMQSVPVTPFSIPPPPQAQPLFNMPPASLPPMFVAPNNNAMPIVLPNNNFQAGARRQLPGGGARPQVTRNPQPIVKTLTALQSGKACHYAIATAANGTAQGAEDDDACDTLVPQDPARKPLTAVPTVDLSDIATRLTRSYNKDSALIDVMKEHCSVELCAQLCRWLEDDCDANCGTLAAEYTPRCAIWRHCVDGRATVLVGISAVLSTPVAHAPDVAPWGLSRCVLRHFDALRSDQRGCIALQRVITAATPDEASADGFVSAITANLGAMMTSQHANYIVSNVINTMTHRAPQPKSDAGGVSVGNDSVASHDSALQSIADASTESPQSSSPAETDSVSPPGVVNVARRSARELTTKSIQLSSRASAAAEEARLDVVGVPIWSAFVATLAATLARDVSAAHRNRCTAHVLENALCRMPFATMPTETHVLLTACLRPAQLSGLCRNPDAFHTVRALLQAMRALPAPQLTAAQELVRELATTDAIGECESSVHLQRVKALLRRTDTTALSLGDAYRPL